MTHPDFRALGTELLYAAQSYLLFTDAETTTAEQRAQRLDSAMGAFRAALSAPQQGAQGLHGKYIIHRSADGSAVEFPCFVLRVDGADDAAMAAIQVYARHPDCPPELAADLVEHVKRHASFAFLGSVPQQGAPSDDDLRGIFYKYSDRGDDGPAWIECEQFIFAARAVLARYGAQAVPVAPSNICTGCNTPRHEAITAIANGAMACCPDCSTLTVEDRNAIRAIKAVPVPVAERLPGEGDCDADGRCWFFSNRFATWSLESPLVARTRGIGRFHWLPHWVLPLPEVK